MNRLLLFAFLWDLLTPCLIAWGVLPAASRYASHAVFALLFVVDAAMILRRSEVPKWVWVFLGICAYGFLVACLNRQELVTTLWGLYQWIKYPMLCLYAYLRPWNGLPVGRWLRQGCWWILGLEVCVQAGQYLAGVEPGDGLAGTLTTRDANATLVLAILILWALAMSLGIWVVRGRFVLLAATVVLGAVSAILGEIKFYFFAAGSYLVVAALLRARLTRSLKPFVLMSGLAVGVGLAFIWAYNRYEPAAEEMSFQTFLERHSLANYLDIEVDMSAENAYKAADVGRVMSVRLGWALINRSTAELLFGHGLGSQNESKTLGKVGAMVAGSRYGLWTGPSVVVFMVELGLVGLSLVLAFCAWTCVVLFRALRARMNLELAVLVNASLIFTLHWPLCLWYSTLWATPAGAFLYFFTLGYVLQRVGQFQEVAEPVPGRALAKGAYAGAPAGGAVPAMQK